MNLRFIYLSSLTTLALLISSCSNQDPLYSDLVFEEYTKSFIQTFGLIDQNQDWNIASRKGVTVNVAKPSEVKVYALIDDVYYLVADYMDVQHSQYLAFDVPKDANKLKVAVGADMRDAMVGGTVDFTKKASRAGDASIKVSYFTEASDANMASWLRMKKDGVMKFNDKIPEDVDNRDKITHNFLYESTGPFTIHPIYWHTDQKNTLGIYYYSDDADAEEVTNYTTNTKVKIKRVPLMSINQTPQTPDGDNIFFYASPTSDNVDGSGYIYKSASEWQPIPYCGKVDAIYGWAGGDATQVMSKGIGVDIPIGMQFGMYIELSSPTDFDGRSGRYFYSQSFLNPDTYYERTYADGQPKTKANRTSSVAKDWQACHAGTFIGSDYGGLALTFEDWNDCFNDSDMDMNDMVFVLFGAGLTKVNPNIIAINDAPITESPYQWIIAAEDLGAIGDFDFNDVVVGVKYVAGQSTATLTPLAAGGTLPVKLMYKGSVVLSPSGDEQFHSWFVGNPSVTTIINTNNPDSYEAKGEVEIVVGSDFSLATLDVNGNVCPNYADGRMGGFSIYVERGDGIFSTIEAPGLGDAPQMICMPGGWAWPKECKNISDAYSRFSDWVASPEDYADWYKSHYNVVLLTGVPYYVESSDSDTGSGGDSGSSPTVITLTSEDCGTIWGIGQLYKFTCEQGLEAGMTLNVTLNITDSQYNYIDLYTTCSSDNLSDSYKHTVYNGGSYTLTADDITNMTGSNGITCFYGITWSGNTISTITSPGTPVE